MKKVLIANRGEIAVRIARACRELGLTSVAVYSEADRTALHVRRADEAYAIGPAPSNESYLRGDRIVEVARRSGCDAIHPGYGFLAENAGFARSCEDAGLTLIGPGSRVIALMGEKTSARRLAVDAGVPIVPGTLAPLRDTEELTREAAHIGFPLMLKAAAGGGGKGLRLVKEAGELRSALERAKSEAKSAFGDDSVYLEKAIERPRHIEIQVFGDSHGAAVHFFERECSIQRRHQKVIEESPSPFLTPELRLHMGRLAVRLAQQVGYVGAGTLEFLVDAARNPYFLEMNTRLQVEHPVTELVTGVDLVQLQIRVARGEVLPMRQDEIVQRGHAIECRVYAEDAEAGFLPSPGRITGLVPPSGPGIRDDSGVYAGFVVPVDYDPLLSKLLAWGSDRDEAIARLRRAVSEYRIAGIRTTLPFFEKVLARPDFQAGDFDTGYVERVQREPSAVREGLAEVAAIAAAIQAYRERKTQTASDAGGSSRSGSQWWQAGLFETQRSRG